MNPLSAKVKNVTVNHETLTVKLIEGRAISAPLLWHPTLAQATPKQLRHWKTCGAGTGIHWPALDYHLSVEGLPRGARKAEGVTRRLLVHACNFKALRSRRKRPAWGFHMLPSAFHLPTFPSPR